MEAASLGAWSVGYFKHEGMIRRAEDHVDYWNQHATIDDATANARWLVGALGADPEAAEDSRRILTEEFRTPHLPNGGSVGWRVGPYDVVLTDNKESNKADVINPMGRLVMVAEELLKRRIDVTVSGYAARAGYDLTKEVRTLLTWDVAELSGALPRLSAKGEKWLETYGDWEVEWYAHFANDHSRAYFAGDEAKARAYGEKLATEKRWRNVWVRSPLGTASVIASDALDIRP